MGIKDLWTILTPFCERKPLYELQGKTVAVDLSCWICEAQNIAEYSVQPKMYLRNLYFRTCYLLLMEVIPVFVLEGKAPTLKYQTIADRNAVQFKGAKPKSDKIKTGKDRTRFHHVLKQCEEMLRYVGLACIQGTGEAEAMCAYLSADDMVAGCISQDSDCFAYGAKVVYRNFSISHQGSYAASGGAVDVYDIEKARKSLGFGRNKVIALALLCGSDYNEGVHGVGKDSAMKFFNRYSDEEILNRMKMWRKNYSMFQELEEKLNNKNICTSCGHFGKLQSHVKVGCIDCKTMKGCDFTKYREERLEIKNELQIRTKALSDPDFPNETLINEYLVQKDNLEKLDLKWKQPNLINFVKFTNKYLAWEEIYAFQKLLPILTRWQVLNYEFVFDKERRNSISEIKGILYPNYIKKKRNPKGIQCYEIVWEDKHNYFEHLIPEEQIIEFKENNNDDLEKLWSTIEPQDLVEKAYPSLIEEFLAKKQKGKKAPKRPRKQKENQEINDLTDQLQNTSISEPKIKKPRKKKQENSSKNLPKTKEKLNTIEAFLKKPPESIANNQLNTSFDFDASKFGDENDLDISDIIEEIITKNVKLPENIEKLGYRVVTSKNELDSDYKVPENYENLNESYFFEVNTGNVDLFEKTFNNISTSCDSSDESTDKKSSDTENDSFEINLIPLADRLKNRLLEK